MLCLHASDIATISDCDERNVVISSFMDRVGRVANAVEYDTMRRLTCDLLDMPGVPRFKSHDMNPEMRKLLTTLFVDDVFALPMDERTTLGIGLHALREYARYHKWHGISYHRALSDPEFVRQACLLERSRSGCAQRCANVCKLSAAKHEVARIRFARKVLDCEPPIRDEMPAVDGSIERWRRFLKRASLAWGRAELTEMGIDASRVHALQDEYTSQVRTAVVSIERPPKLVQLLFHVDGLVSHEPPLYSKHIAQAYGISCFQEVFVTSGDAAADRNLSDMFTDSMHNAINAFCRAHPDVIERRGLDYTIADERAAEIGATLIASETEERRRSAEKRLRKRDKKKRKLKSERRAFAESCECDDVVPQAAAAAAEEPTAPPAAADPRPPTDDEPPPFVFPLAALSERNFQSDDGAVDFAESVVAEHDASEEHDAALDEEQFEWQQWYDTAPAVLGSGLCLSIESMFGDDASAKPVISFTVEV